MGNWVQLSDARHVSGAFEHNPVGHVPTGTADLTSNQPLSPEERVSNGAGGSTPNNHGWVHK